MNNFELQIKKTAELSGNEMLQILQARINVFVVEQACPYPEVDDKDFNATHVLLKKNNVIVAYSRIIPHDDGTHISFGRVLVIEQFRNQQLGRKIVQATLDEIQQQFPTQNIKISAQNYIKQFYASFGFNAVSDVYLEDDIPHIDMVLNT